METRASDTDKDRDGVRREAPGDESILPRSGKPVGDSPVRSGGNHGVLDPAEDGHPLPEGLERKRAGPLRTDAGRRKTQGR